MVEKETLQKIAFLKDLSEPMLEKIGLVAQLETFDEESVLFRQNQELTLLYMLVSGKVFLNSRSAQGRSLTLDEVTAGRTFGVSALMGGFSSTFTAVCAETSSIITVSGEKIRELFEKDFEVGHTIMEKVVELYKSRMEMYTRQFLHSLSTHSEIKKS